MIRGAKYEGLLPKDLVKRMALVPSQESRIRIVPLNLRHIASLLELCATAMTDSDSRIKDVSHMTYESILLVTGCSGHAVSRLNLTAGSLDYVAIEFFSNLFYLKPTLRLSGLH